MMTTIKSIRKYALLALSIAFFYGCGPAESVSLNPTPTVGDQYTYQVEGESVRSFSDNEETMTQNYEFVMTVKQGQEGSYPVEVTFNEFSMETPEDDLYEDIYMGVLETLKTEPSNYTINTDGTLSYQSVSNEDEEEFPDFEDPEAYLARMADFMLESLRVNLFTEWIAYVPEEPINKKSTWQTTSDLSLMSITEVDRIFDWTVEKITDSEVHLKGYSKVSQFEFDMQISQDQSLELLFDGDIISTYTYELDRDNMLVKKGHIQIITNGNLKSRNPVEGEEVIDEALTGEANTYITRK